MDKDFIDEQFQKFINTCHTQQYAPLCVITAKEDGSTFILYDLSLPIEDIVTTLRDLANVLEEKSSGSKLN